MPPGVEEKLGPDEESSHWCVKCCQHFREIKPESWHLYLTAWRPRATSIRAVPLGDSSWGAGEEKLHAANTYNCFLEFCLKRETRKYVVAIQGVGCN